MLIEPGPVLLVTTQSHGKKNIMTITWHMVLDFTPRIALATGTWNYSYRALRETKECVLSIPAVDLAEKAVPIGDCSGANVDKFRKFGLTPLPAATGESPADCRMPGRPRMPCYRIHGVPRDIPPARDACMDKPGSERTPDVPCKRRRYFRADDGAEAAIQA